MPHITGHTHVPKWASCCPATPDGDGSRRARGRGASPEALALETAGLAFAGMIQKEVWVREPAWVDAWRPDSMGHAGEQQAIGRAASKDA